jgi:hypothetical protein
MANEQNLTHKLTVSEQRKGGKRSGEVRREQKTFKDLAKKILALKPSNEELKRTAKLLGVDDPDNKELAVIGLMLSAINGNHNAFDRLLELTGEKEQTTDEQTKQADLLSAIQKAVRNDN